MGTLAPWTSSGRTRPKTPPARTRRPTRTTFPPSRRATTPRWATRTSTRATPPEPPEPPDRGTGPPHPAVRRPAPRGLGADRPRRGRRLRGGGDHRRGRRPPGP